MRAAENKAVFLSYASPAFAKATADRRDFSSEGRHLS